MRLTISQISEATGVSPSCLRIWELRYGWPCPRRDPDNGYRRYDPELIEDIKRVMFLVSKGRNLRDLIDDNGCLCPMLPSPPKAERVPVGVYAMLPIPETSRGVEARREMVKALDAEDAAKVCKLLQEITTVHPCDRVTAVMAPVALWVIIGRDTGVRTRVMEHVMDGFIPVAAEQLHAVMELAEGCAELWRAEATTKPKVKPKPVAEPPPPPPPPVIHKRKEKRTPIPHRVMVAYGSRMKVS